MVAGADGAVAKIDKKTMNVIDEAQMGDLFKVMFITNLKNKFNLGF